VSNAQWCIIDAPSVHRFSRYTRILLEHAMLHIGDYRGCELDVRSRMRGLHMD